MIATANALELISDGGTIGGVPAGEWVASVVAELQALPNVPTFVCGDPQQCEGANSGLRFASLGVGYGCLRNTGLFCKFGLGHVFRLA